MTKDEFISSINKDFDALPDKVKQHYPVITRSDIIERVMRLGRASRAWGLKTDEEHDEVARATIKDDFYQCYKKRGIEGIEFHYPKQI